MGLPGATELLIIAAVVVLLFGAKKMPDMARAVGRSMRIFKAETKTMREEEGQIPSPDQQQPNVTGTQVQSGTHQTPTTSTPQVAPPLHKGDNR